MYVWVFIHFIAYILQTYTAIMFSRWKASVTNKTKQNHWKHNRLGNKKSTDKVIDREIVRYLIIKQL